MAKIEYFTMDVSGMQALKEFQKENHIVNFRFGAFDLPDSHSQRTIKQWCQVVLYIPASMIKPPPQGELDGTDKPKTDVGKRGRSASKDTDEPDKN